MNRSKFTILILPDSLQVEVCSALASAHTPSLLTAVSALTEAKPDARSRAGNVQTASASAVAFSGLLDGLGSCAQLVFPICLDGFPFQIGGILDCLERRHAWRAGSSRGRGGWNTGEGRVASIVIQRRVTFIETRSCGK